MTRRWVTLFAIVVLVVASSVAGVAQQESIDELRARAEQGDAEVQGYLGVKYASGDGVPQDYAEAVHWFRLAADQGHTGAQYNLGVMYSEAVGVQRDDTEALRWYRLAASQGDAGAQHNIGVMYLNASGVSRDDAEAANWFLLAAEQGNPSSQYNLGFLYREGRGVTQDDIEARRWFRLAADQGVAEAESALAIMQSEAGRSQDNGENQASSDDQMSTALKLFLLALPLSFFKRFVDWPIFIITVLAGLVSLVTPIAAPREYVVMAIALYVFSLLPRLRLSATSIMSKLIPEPKPSQQASGGMSEWQVKRSLGDTLLGATTGLAYNAYWLDYAANNDQSWLIHLCWFSAAMTAWSLLALVVLDHHSRSRLGQS